MYIYIHIYIYIYTYIYIYSKANYKPHWLGAELGANVCKALGPSPPSPRLDPHHDFSKAPLLKHILNHTGSEQSWALMSV